MIKDIVEVNFPSYATLHQASISIQEMGDRTITTQVKIDGSVIPDFSYDWEILFKGERYIHPIREPQAAKDNTSFNSTIEMVFQHWAIYQLKRYYFMEMTSVEAGTAIADKYEASLALTLPKFVDAFNNVLSYYFGDKIVMVLNDAATYEEAPQFIEIKYSHIWEVLTSIYDTYAVRWNIVYNAHLDRYEIRVGFESEVSVDHIFEYGFNGGLLKFERAVQNTDLANILLGRGGEKNLPTWYFKNPALFTEGGDNELFKPDPDAIPELKDVVFTELRGWTFRMYVRGWMTNQHRIKTLYKKDGSVLWSAGTLPAKDETLYETNWAYRKGCDDLKFNPPEYVKSESSIEQYGEIWGSLDNNAEIFPSIQGVEVSPYGRIDEVIDVEEVTTDDIESMAAAAVVTNVEYLDVSVWMPKRSETDGGAGYKTFKQGSRAFSIPEGKVGSLTANFHIENSAVNTGITLLASKSILIVKNAVTGEILPNAQSIPAGHYYYRWEITLYNPSETGATVTIGAQGVKLTTSDVSNMAWRPTFDIWVKNIFNTQKGEFETEDAYVERVWLPILGSRGEEAAVTFATGWLSGHEDWDFTIVGNIFNGIHYDTSKARDGIHSEWRITLQKSDAELDATGKYIPYVGFNAHSGDRFFFTGIDMPFEYVFWAEQRLDTYKMESLSDSAHIHPTWSVQLDKVRTNLFDSEYGKKLVDALSAGALIHIRDHRFTKGDVLNLYIQRIAYTWNEGMDIPNVELTLSDTIYVSQSNSERMQSQINALQRDYISISTVEDTVKTIVARSYLSKTQRSDTSFTQTAFAAPIISDNFEQGRSGGSGWGVYKDGDRASVIEADKIIVRQKLDVNELVVNQISAAGGKQIVSAANMECTQVVDSPDGYICYFDQKRGSVGNTFAMHDIAMGQRFDTTNAESWYYKREVVGLGENYIVLSKTNCSSGADIPREGDIIVQMGNLYDIDRQAAHVIAAYGPNAPSYTMFADLDGFNTEGKDVFGVEYRAVEGSQTNFTSLGADDFEESGGNSVVFGSGKREPFFYNYGSMLLGDRNQQNGFILYDNPTKTLRISAEVHFLPTSTGLEGLPKWQELSGKVDELQSQVDGTIETWFADGEPTLNNYPASEWKTDTERNNHLGDLYYDNKTGKAYRFLLADSGAYNWVYIADSDIAKALKDAADALAAANSAIKGIDVEYAVNNTSATAPETGWQTTAPARGEGQFLWQRTKTTTNNGAQYSTPVCISGIDGAMPTIVNGYWYINGNPTGIKAEGVDGQPGSDGLTPTIGSNGHWFIGTTDTGIMARGSDGNSITGVTEYYGVSANANTSPTTWVVNSIPSNYGENMPCLWNYEVIHNSKDPDISTTPALVGIWAKDGRPGDPGADGKGIASITDYYQISASSVDVPTAWSTTPITPTDDKPFLWNYEKVTFTDGTTQNLTAAVIGVKGNAGTTPRIVNGYWWIGDVNTGIPATGEAGDTPEIGANGNWWIGGSDTGYPARGEDGNSITGVVEYYGVSDNAVTRPTLWDTTIPSNYGETYPYLWNYEQILNSKADTISTTPVIIGVYGKDGDGVARIVEHYQISNSKVTAPTTWSDTFIAPTADKPYLWNYETIYYTKRDPVDTVPAIVGAVGASIESVEELYYLSINAFAPSAPTDIVTETRKITGAWTKTCPDWVNGYTYFVCSQIIRTDGTFEFTDVMSAGNIKTHTFYTAEGEYPRPPYNKGDYWICASYNDGGAASAAISQVEDGNMAVDIEEGGFAANDGPISDSAGNDLGYELAVVAADTTGGVSYTNEILVCINSKASGESFSINDWQPAGDYAKNSDYDYLRAALPRTEAVINGGLILGSFIGVSNAQSGSVSEGNIVAGMAGVAGANDEFRQITDPTTGSSRQLLIFAGVTGDASDLNRYKTAAVQIWSDGYFVAQSGVIGGLTVSNDGISYAPNEGSSPTMYIRRDSCLLPNAQIEGCVQTKMTGDGDQSFISLAQANGRPMLRINASNLTGNAPDTMLYLHHGSTIFNVNPGGWFTTLNIDSGFDILSRTLPTTNGTLVIPSFKLKFGCHDVSRTIQYQVKVIRFTAGTTGVDTAYQYNSGSFSSNGSHEFIIPQYTLEVKPFYEYGLAVYVQGAIHSGLGNTAYLNCYVDENTVGRISYGSSNIQPGCFIGANGLDFTMGPQQKFQYITTPVAVLNGNIRRDGRNSGGQFEISLTANDENQIGLKGNGNLDAAGSVVGAAMYINLGSGWRKLKIENNHLMVE